MRKALRRNTDLLRAQLRTFDERTRYLAYPEANGTQILYSAPPLVHLRVLERTGFQPIAVYGVRGPSFRKGPHTVTRVDVTNPTALALARLARVALTSPHVHYVAVKR